MAAAQIQSLQRAIRILEVLKEADTPLPLKDLSQRTGLSKSTIYRMLATMRDVDIIEQMPDGRYMLGLKLLELGCSVGSMRDVAQIAKPYLQTVSQKTGESVSLALISRGEVLILSFVESASAFHVVTRTGAKLPVHCTVQGKIMLAYMPDSEVKRILKEHGMRIYTPTTINTYEELKEELVTIRHQGFAVDNSEFHVGLHSVAAPIFDAAGDACYSFAVVSMSHRIESPEFELAKSLAISAGRDISRALGYRS